MRSPFLIRSLVVLSALCVTSQVSAQSKPKREHFDTRLTRSARGDDELNKKLREALDLLQRQQAANVEQEAVLQRLEEALVELRKRPRPAVGREIGFDKRGAKSTQFTFDRAKQEAQLRSREEQAKKARTRSDGVFMFEDDDGTHAREVSEAARRAMLNARGEYARAAKLAEQARVKEEVPERVALRLPGRQDPFSLGKSSSGKSDRAKIARLRALEYLQRNSDERDSVLEVIDFQDPESGQRKASVSRYFALKKAADRPDVAYLLPGRDPRVAAVERLHMVEKREQEDDDGGNGDIVEAIGDVARELRAIRKLMERAHGRVREHRNTDAFKPDLSKVFWGRLEDGAVVVDLEDVPAADGKEGASDVSQRAVLEWVYEAPPAKDTVRTTRKRLTDFWTTTAPKDVKKNELRRVELVPEVQAIDTVRWHELKTKASNDQPPTPRRAPKVIRYNKDGTHDLLLAPPVINRSDNSQPSDPPGPSAPSRAGGRSVPPGPSAPPPEPVPTPLRRSRIH